MKAKLVNKIVKVDAGQHAGEEEFLKGTYRIATDDEIIAALWAAHGYVSMASRELGVSIRTIQRRINSSEKVKKVVHEILETSLDAAEEILRQRMQEDTRAVEFYLKCKGRHRGYTSDHNPLVNDDVVKRNLLIYKPEKRIE